MRQNSKIKQKEKENAEIKASLIKNKTLSLKRLLHDYEEIKSQIITVPGVSAFPLDDNIYEWHGNIKCLANNIYKGAILHFKFSFSTNYPITPPNIYILNDNFTHPNILENGKICLDILDKNGKDYEGWKYEYTILSILLQMQSFFFEVNENFLTETNQKKIKNEIISLSEFICPKCKHRGSTNPFPDLPKDLNTKLTLDQYKQAKKEELCCCCNKESFQKNPIGIGLKISKMQQTNKLISILPCYDFISLKAFSKEKLRYSFEGQRFTHWFPLYFGEEDKKDKFLNSATKAISMILEGNTKEFEPYLIIKVVPKLFDSICVSIVSENIHNSYKTLRILIYIFRILIILIKTFPDFEETINEKVGNFIKDPETRIKERTPSLSELLAMVSISKFSINEILSSILSENLDRQIELILKEFPKFEKLIKNSEIDEVTAKACFKAGITENQILIFYYYLITKIVFSDCKTLDQFAEKLDKNYGCLTEIEIDKHRTEINKILKIDNYNDFYIFFGKESPNKEELNNLLKQAYQNSKDKKYGDTHYIPLLEPKKQIELYMKKYAFFEELLENEKLIESDNKKWEKLINKLDIVKQYKYKYPNTKLTPLNIIKFYREILNEKLFFEPYKKEEFIIKNKKKTKGNNKSKIRRNKVEIEKKDDNKKEEENTDKVKNEDNKNNKKRFGKIYKKYNFDSNYNCKMIVKNKKEAKINKRKFIKKIEDEHILSQLTWRQLYLKLFFEDYCKYFNFIADFKQIYKLLDYIKDDIIHFSLIISGNNNLKSDYNYIRVILSKLTSLKYLELIFDSKINKNLIKNLEKGIFNGLKQKTSIEHLKIIVSPNESIQTSFKELNIFTLLGNLPSLKVLDINNISLNLEKVISIKNHLYNYKTLKVLDLSYCSLNDEMCNELADGLMKAKSLEKLYIVENKMNKGLSNILYNLAFQPSIKFINISNNKLCDKNEVAISLQKLIKMSKSLETIICNNIPGLNDSLNKDFFISLGDNINLSYLDLSYNGKFSDINLLGKALAFNSLKKGALSYLDISGCIYKYDVFNDFIKSMSISEDDHFELYGYRFNSNILKESPEYFNKIYHINLKTLVLKDSNLVCDFNYNSHIKEIKSENYMEKLLNKSELDTLILDNARFNKNFLESISESLKSQNNLKYLSFSNCAMNSEALKCFLSGFYEIEDNNIIDEENKINNNKRHKKRKVKELVNIINNKNIHILGLDLSCNKIAYSGIYHLCEILKVNKTIEYLNLFHNRIGISGAFLVGESLKQNNILTDFDIGYNRIKNNGFIKIINGLMENKNSVLKKLSVKYNFLHDVEEIEKYLDIKDQSENNSLEEIELKNNILSKEYILRLWNKKSNIMNKSINMDIFDILYYLEPERLERTIWVNVNNLNTNVLYKKVDFSYRYMGIPLSIKKIRGRKIGHKKDKSIKNLFIEFISPNNVKSAIQKEEAQYYHLYFPFDVKNICKIGERLDYLFVKRKKTKSIKSINS